MSKGAPRPHLTASFLALLITSVALTFGYGWCRNVERDHVASLTSDLSDPKLHGVAIQREAFKHDDLLVLYGSSELVKLAPSAAPEFFQDYPTGFRVFPVGKEGTSALAIMQKIAAVGSDLNGRKVVFSLSPSFFFQELNAKWYEGNFSPLQAGELVFSGDLSFDLKRDAARRLLAYPETLNDHWLLEAAAYRLARGSKLDKALYYAALPLGRLQNAVGRLQDHFEAALHIVERPPTPDQPRVRRVMNWDDALRKADGIARQLAAKVKVQPKIKQRPTGSRDGVFLARLKQATEWKDFDLALRVVRELGGEPLLLSMPVHAKDLETVGVSRKARVAYPERLSLLAAEHGAPLVYFQKHEEDPLFFSDHLDHLSSLGWTYYNETLDDFFHGRDPNL
jgi:D-alanine transfer protein